MIESQEVSGRKRRSGEEIQRLMMEFESSGLRQNEFCRNHGLALSTLQRQLKKRRVKNGEAKAWGERSRAESHRLVAVECCTWLPRAGVSATHLSPKSNTRLIELWCSFGCTSSVQDIQNVRVDDALSEPLRNLSSSNR